MVEDRMFVNVLRKQHKEVDFDFDYTLNPYQGCSYGCSECYVQSMFPSVIQAKGGWGNFVEIRRRTVEMLEKNKKRLRGKKIFASTATDLWMPEAYKSGLTRDILEKLVEIDFSLCVLSTRSTLLLKDVDLLRKMKGKIEVGISIPTDRIDVTNLLHPHVATPRGRFNAAKQLKNDGINVRIQMAPCLPYTNHFANLVSDSAQWLLLDYCSYQSLPYKNLLCENGFGYCLSRDWTRKQFEYFKSVLGENKVKLGEDYFAWSYDKIQQGYT
ncbi:MAG: radical SAM protein [Nitrososphaerales archaeon]